MSNESLRPKRPPETQTPRPAKPRPDRPLLPKPGQPYLLFKAFKSWLRRDRDSQE